MQFNRSRPLSLSSSPSVFSCGRIDGIRPAGWLAGWLEVRKLFACAFAALSPRFTRFDPNTNESDGFARKTFVFSFRLCANEMILLLLLQLDLLLPRSSVGRIVARPTKAVSRESSHSSHFSPLSLSDDTSSTVARPPMKKHPKHGTKMRAPTMGVLLFHGTLHPIPNPEAIFIVRGRRRHFFNSTGNARGKRRHSIYTYAR